MCGSIITDELALVVQAREAAEEILERCYRMPIVKRITLGTPEEFDRAVGVLAARLRGSVASLDQAAAQAAMQSLDIDWSSTTAEQRDRLFVSAMEAVGASLRGVGVPIEALFGKAAQEVVRAARDHTRQEGNLAISVDFNAVDRRIIRHLRRSEANYVRDEYGRRQDQFAGTARQIVARGLKAGLGRQDIARDLSDAAQSIIAGRDSFYWETVAGSFIGRGRSYAQLSALAEAGIERYQFVAVLDERTTNICRYMHGRTFEVRRGIQLFESVEANPESIMELAPWVRDAVDSETGRTYLYIRRGDERIRLIDVTRSGFGLRDDRGEFSQDLSSQDLAAQGILVPPVHACCRSSLSILS